MEKLNSNKLCCFPIGRRGIIKGYDNDNLDMPIKILEMGLLPHIIFRVLYQAPFDGPLYIAYDNEKSKVALRVEEARYIIVEEIGDGN